MNYNLIIHDIIENKEVKVIFLIDHSYLEGPIWIWIIHSSFLSIWLRQRQTTTMTVLCPFYLAPTTSDDDNDSDIRQQRRLFSEDFLNTKVKSVIFFLTLHDDYHLDHRRAYCGA